MLLRSSSTPLLDSWIPQSKESTVEAHAHHDSVAPPIPKTRSLSMTLSRSPSISSSNDGDSVRKMTRPLSASDLKELSVPRKKPLDTGALPSIPVEAEEDEDLDLWAMKNLFMSSGLDGSVLEKDDGFDVDTKEKVLPAGNGGNGGNGNSRCGGGRESDSNDNHGKASMETYYQNMIQANPGNALFLFNYAKFLKEVKCDLEKAEEYSARAILENPDDGAVLSLHADIIWQQHKDAPRAESYFDQAAQASPDDCYVMASYARFLWDAEDEEGDDTEEQVEVEEHEINSHNNRTLQLNYFNGTPLTAAS